MNFKRILSVGLATVMTLQTVAFANETTFSSFDDKSIMKHKEEVSVIASYNNKTHSSKMLELYNEQVENNRSIISNRTQRKRINPKTEKYEMAKPNKGEIRVITTYKNKPIVDNGRNIGGKHRAMNVSRSNLDTMLTSSDIVMIENDYLVYRTSVDTVNVKSDMDMSVMIGNFYPSSFDNLAVQEYHEKNVFGTDVKIAIFDTGLNTKSTELNIIGGATFVDGSDSFADDNGHGTSMAGIIGAAMDNEGITGIAPNAELYSVKVLDSNGIGYTSSVIEGIYWAVENNIDIICFGFATEEYSNALAEAVVYAKDNGILMIAPSGNDGENTVMYPAGYNEVVSVGSVNNDGVISSFSNTGATVDFYAPGENVDSIVYVNNKPTPVSGTSASAAHAVGFAALLMEENKGNDEFDVFEYFLRTAVETELGFVENTENEFATMSVNEMETLAVQNSADELSLTSDEDNVVMATSVTATTAISFDEQVTRRLTSSNKKHNYLFNTNYSSQVVTFAMTGNNCKVYYEDEYSGLNIDVTNQSLVLQKGEQRIHVAYDYFEDFTTTDYTLTITLEDYIPFENKKKTQNGVYEPSGEFGYTFDDFITVVGEKEFKIQRHFNSSDNTSNHFNIGWSLNFEKKAREIDNSFISTSLPDGTVLYFERHIGSDGDIDYLPINSRARVNVNDDLTNSVVVTMPDQTKYYYYPIKSSSVGFYPDTKSLGYLYQIIDRYGNVTNITIDGGKIIEIEDCVDNVYTFNYDTDDKLVSLSDSTGRVVTYIYNGKKLVQSTDAAGITYYYSYDGYGLLNEIKNASGAVMASVIYEVDYDYEDIDVFKVDTKTDKYGTTYKYEYDTINACTIVREIPEEDGDYYRERTSTYDAEKDIVYSKDEIGRQAYVEYFYQQEGRVTLDSDGDPCFQVDEDYRKWKNGEILRQVDYTGLITEYGYDPIDGNGLAESKTVTNSLGEILEYEEYEYNTNGDVTSLESWINRPATVSERTRKATRFEYDGTKLVKKAEYLPTLVGNASAPALNNTNLGKYAVTSYEYDTENAIKGLVSKVVYPSQYTGAATDKGWVYEYDAKGNQISVTNPESTETNIIKDTYEYNNFGLVSKHTSGEGVVTEYEYNNNLQETKKTVTTESGTEVTFTEYNNLGLPVQIVSPNEYDAACEENDGTYSDETVGVRYTYNNNGTLASETDNEGNSVQYEYDRFGNIQTKTMPDGMKYKYSYDDISNVTLEYYYWNNELPVLFDHSYYYSNGNVSYDVFSEDENDNDLTAFRTEYNYRGNPILYADMLNGGIGEYRKLFYDLQGNLVNDYYIDRGSPKHKETYYTNDNFDAVATTTYDEKFALIDDMWGAVVAREFDIPSDTTYKYERTDYDKNGNVVRTLVSTVAEGSTPTLAEANVIVETNEYYADNLLKSKTDVYGVKTEYEYDKDRNLSKVTVTEPGKTPQIITYTNSHNGKPETIKTYVDDTNLTDSSNLLTDSLGTYTLTTNTYDKNGNLTKQVSSTGLTTEYTYNDNNLQTSVTSYVTGNTSSSHTEGVVYDFRGNVTQQTDKNGNVTKFVYNELGYLIYTIHPNGRITLTTRDKYGKLLAEVDAVDYNGAATVDNATVTTYETDKANLATMTRTEYTYDQFDRVVTVTRHTYDPETETNTSVVRQTNTYDAYGNLVDTTDANGNTIGYEYDVFGNCIKYVEPSKYGTEGAYTTLYEYDMLGRKIKEGNSNGDYYAYTYDKKGNILSSAIVEDGESQTISTYTYDDGGRILTQTGGEGNTTTLVYDDNNRLMKQYAHGGANDDSKTDYYSYDSLGNLTEHTTRNGDTIEYEYDVFNRLVKTTSDDGVVTYTYDNNGNILTMTDSTGTTTYTYDSMGRILTKTHSETGTISYSYDNYENIPYGYVAEITTEPDGDSVEKWYDSEDKIVKVVDGSDITEYNYYADGRPKSTTKPDGSVSTNTYDDEGNLLTLVTLDAAEDVLDSFTYVYDDNSIGYKNQISKTEIVAGVNKGTTTYEYDIKGQLTKVTNPDGSTNEYTYDDAGNRLTKTATSGETVVVTNYTYDEQNRLTQSVTGDATTYYGYDNNGNQISEWTRIANSAAVSDGVQLGLQNEATDALLTLYAYDVFDRLIKIEQGADVIENAYTADGKKLSRTTNGEVTYYVYDGNVVIEEQDSENDETARNVYGRSLITRETSDGFVVYAYNGHSDVVAICDIDGDVLVTYTYDEFGNLIDEAVVDEDYANFDNPYRYAGYEYIEKVKLYDLNARYYNPEIARFLSPDPYYNLGNRVIGLYEINVPNAWKIVFSNALYTYCGNNPIGFNDNSGLDPIPKWAARIKYGGATDEDYNEALRIHSIGAASAWAGSARFIVDYAINKAIERNNADELISRQQLIDFANKYSEKYENGLYLGWMDISQKSIDELNDMLITFDITDKNEIAHLLSQCFVESWYGRSLTEIDWTFSQDEVAYFNEKYGDYPYLGNLGTDTNDGYNFRGAGYIHLTGRYNYTKFSEYMGDPKIVERGADYVAENYAWAVAGYYWVSHVQGEFENNSYPSVADVTRKINPGMSQKQERSNAYAILSEVLNQ